MTQLHEEAATSSDGVGTGTSVESPSSADGGSTSRSLSGAVNTVLDALGRGAVLGGYCLLLIYFAVRTPDTFLSTNALRTVLDQSAVPLILAVGITVILAVGEFDLAYTSIVGFTGASTVMLMSKGWPVQSAVAIGLAGALLVGLVIGIIVASTKASSFIVTLAVGSVVTGIELSITGNTTVYNGIPEGYAKLARNEFLSFRWPVWGAIIIFALAWVVMHRMKYGRHAYAVGENPTAAYLAGVPVRRITIIAFVVVGLLSAVGAIILTSRSVSYYPNSSAGLLLNTYAAVFLGAAATRRGRFTILGTGIGVLWIVTLQVGLTLLNEPTALVSLIQGAVLAAAVLLAARGRRA